MTYDTFDSDADGDVDSPQISTNQLSLTPQDLSALTPDSGDDGSVFYHDGSGTITADGSTTSTAGPYRWDNSATEWKRWESGLSTGGDGVFQDSGSSNVDGGTVIQAPGVEDSLDMQQGDVSAERLFMNFASTTQEARSDRPLVTTEDTVLYVDPGTGDDSLDNKEVTESNPLQTLNEALSRIPYLVLHNFEIDLATAASTPVTYNSVTAYSTGATHINTWNTLGVKPALRIYGDPTDASAVTIDNNFFNIATSTPETDDLGTDGSGNPEASLAYLTFNGNINNKNGMLRIDNCRFTGVNNTSAILGKAGGKTVLSNNVFTDGLDHAVNLSSIGAEAVLDGTAGNTVNVQQQTVDIEAGATARFIQDIPRGRQGAWRVVSGATLIFDKGRTAAVRKLFTDDFNDGRLGADIDSERGTLDREQYRVEWEQQNGSSEASLTNDGQRMVIPPGNTTRMVARCRNAYNYFNKWQVDVEFNSAPGSGDFRVASNAFGDTGREGVEYVLGSDGSISAEYYQDDGTDDTSFVTGGSWGVDTDPHTLSMTRNDGYTYELFFDGTSQGSNTDSYLKTGSLFTNFLIENTTDSEVYVPYVDVR